MIKIGDKELRNLEEQVQKNKDDIEGLKSGIKPEKRLNSIEELATYITNENMGNYYLVGTTAPLILYYITRSDNEELTAVNLGYFPAQGPQGATGATGATGAQGPRGFIGSQGPVGLTGQGVDTMTEIDIAGDPSVNYNRETKLAQIRNVAQIKYSSGDPHDIIFSEEFPINTKTGINIDTDSNNRLNIGLDVAGAVSGQVLRFNGETVDWYTIPDGIPVIDGLDANYNQDFNNLSGLDTGLYIIKNFTVNMPTVLTINTCLLEVESFALSGEKSYTITTFDAIATRDKSGSNVWSDWNIIKLSENQTTITLIDTNWTALSNSYPFSWQQTINNPFMYVPVDEVELINNNAVLFAQHGFAINNYTNTSITIIAVKKPSDSVNLVVRYK